MAVETFVLLQVNEFTASLASKVAWTIVFLTDLVLLPLPTPRGEIRRADKVQRFIPPADYDVTIVVHERWNAVAEVRMSSVGSV